MSGSIIPVFDGHNDTLLRHVMNAGTAKEVSFFTENQKGHIDLPKARKGGLQGGLFAMFVPSKYDDKSGVPFDPEDPTNFAPIDQPGALNFTNRMFAMARRWERESDGQVVIARSVAEARLAMSEGKLAMIMHIEGAEAIDKDFCALEVLYAAGLRSIGPVWSRKNIFADGVPMAFPSSPDTGTGLTGMGRELIVNCNRMGVMIDLSHITEKGFWDVAGLSSKPLVASHSNVHALSPSARNLTDKQLDAIRESQGLVGINYHVAFLREDGAHDVNTPMDVLVRHAAYLVEKLGEDGVALGSDFDGCLVPDAIKDAAGLPKLLEALRRSGFGDKLVKKIAHENWLSVLERTGV
ncbi:peptidase [Kiloniella spongiae]|uniref:Peptidase n=1 Tax=Kiloniella spongiae TaxID=1489064 RepID=A0A0H2MIY9_9PROT|nr:dipeptidase [Kiloniella spongiae]KLN60717.1 peptidase [Kiloniella spongiae]